MSPLHSAQAPIAITNDTEKLLAGVQANILQPHARNHVILLFLNFADDETAFRTWLTEIGPGLTTAADQLAASRYFAGIERRSTSVMTVSLTCHAYRLLGKDDSGMFEEISDSEVPDYPFSEGMLGRPALRQDPPVEHWVEDLRQSAGNELHALVLLADSNWPRLFDEAGRTIQALPTTARVVARREGHVLLRHIEGKGRLPIEHFGFRDGISQPLFFSYEVDAVAASDGISVWKPGAPPALVLRPDPFGADHEACGSMLVFRQLAQDVTGFTAREAALRAALGATSITHEKMIEAMIVGRDRDGVPRLTSRPDTTNNFSFKDDRQSPFRCPAHAHIRKVNPRVEMRASDNSAMRILARRSITYGVNPKTLTALDEETERGILFMCYQRSINRQFEFVQSTWLQDERFPAPQTGIDPLAGVDGTVLHTWPPLRDGEKDLPLLFGNFVTLRGGGYFFTPSLSFFETLT